MEKTLEQKWQDLLENMSPAEMAVLTDRALRSAMVMQEVLVEQRIDSDEPAYAAIQGCTYKMLAHLL
jgi:hypothetical protein